MKHLLAAAFIGLAISLSMTFCFLRASAEISRLAFENAKLKADNFEMATRIELRK